MENVIKLGKDSEEKPVEMPRAVDVAYRAIRDAIIQGDLLEGQSLVEADLAKTIGVSRTPIREALFRLRSEGLVVLERYKKHHVAHFDEEDLKELVEVKAMLEGYMAQRAATRITKEQLELLDELEQQMEALLESNKDTQSVRQEWFDLNEKFHGLIREAAGTGRTEMLLRDSLDLPARLFTPLDDRLTKYLERGCQYHRNIIAALRVRDPSLAREGMYAHKIAVLDINAETLLD